MAEKLISMGLDVGTTTSQLIFSELWVENRAGVFAVPELAVTGRKILYKSPVTFTPLKGEDLVDGGALEQWVMSQYDRAGFTPQQVDTGAVIITGETSRKENARQVVQALAGLGGDFVVATAGPHLESLLAAKGAGTALESQTDATPILHMDIGGGTTNLALFQKGRLLRTGCLNIGGRLLKFDADGSISYVSPALQGLTELKTGMKPQEHQLMDIARTLTHGLEMAAGLRPVDTLLEKLSTQEAGAPFEPAPPGTQVRFSGGVAECIYGDFPWLSFGDLGPLLGKSIRESPLFQKGKAGEQTIRATVIGAGCHSTQLSGSTVMCENAALPVKNLPVVCLTAEEVKDPQAILHRCEQQDVTPVLALPPMDAGYEQICRLADSLCQTGLRPLYVAVEQDMAKALGQALSLRLPKGHPLVCLDGLHLQEGDYLDIATPIGPAYPVIIKTLILNPIQAGERGR